MLKETHIDDVIDELYIDSFGHKGDNEIKILSEYLTRTEYCIILSVFRSRCEDLEEQEIDRIINELPTKEIKEMKTVGADRFTETVIRCGNLTRYEFLYKISCSCFFFNANLDINDFIKQGYMDRKQGTKRVFDALRNRIMDFCFWADVPLEGECTFSWNNGNKNINILMDELKKSVSISNQRKKKLFRLGHYHLDSGSNDKW